MTLSQRTQTTQAWPTARLVGVSGSSSCTGDYDARMTWTYLYFLYLTRSREAKPVADGVAMQDVVAEGVEAKAVAAAAGWTVELVAEPGVE